jgi:hypothetical protein
MVPGRVVAGQVDLPLPLIMQEWFMALGRQLKLAAVHADPRSDR